MQKRQRNIIVKNLANIVSILGVLPICMLLSEHGYQYLLPLIIYNNIMDDLDGVLAGMLNIRSGFGALMDNVCDSIPHTVFVMIVGMHFLEAAENPYVGGLCLFSALLASGSIILRVVTRIDPNFTAGTGSPTNELVRHIFFVLIIAELIGFDPTPLLIMACILHAVSMLAPFKMPYMIRSLATSVVAVGAVNVALLVAWLLPITAPFIAVPFVVAYLASFALGGYRWYSSKDVVHT